MNVCNFISGFLCSTLCVYSFLLSGAHSNPPNPVKYLDEAKTNHSSSNSSFPADFLFGASTAAYQVEGGWNVDGKGENIWDRLVHTRPDIFKNRSTGDVACDSYRLFKEDVALLKDVGVYVHSNSSAVFDSGFQVYRFSISWARILPNGEITHVNEAGVNHYHALIDELLKNGIEPMVTMYHWDLPQRLQDMGGWLNPLINDFFEDYADLLFTLYGKKVKYWITINEPESIVSGYSYWLTPEKLYAPGLPLDSPSNYIVAYNLLRAHARVYRLYDKKYRATQNGKISFSIESDYYREKTTAREDGEATARAWAFGFEIYAHPIYSETGDFPEIVKRIVADNSKQEGRRRSRLPQFTPEEIASIKGSSDFLALNHYLTCLVTAGQAPYPTLREKDKGAKCEADPKWPLDHLNITVVPWGLRELLRFIKDKYNNPPVFITENGYCDKPGVLDDVKRVDFFREYLRQVLKAKEQFGCNVIGYTAWSLLDNFEWNEGYEYTFGIYDVDFKDPTRKRTARSSAKFFKELLKTRTIPA